MTGELSGGSSEESTPQRDAYTACLGDDGYHIVPLEAQIKLFKWIGKQLGRDYSDFFEEEEWNNIA